ncbi:MAG: N-acetylmuramoyl-L-alanine amidase [Rhodobacteraceae bacterium]|nr:N-acetylmuramoyl-L-alanine amidase [Paracoccaceae bacterium]
MRILRAVLAAVLCAAAVALAGAAAADPGLNALARLESAATSVRDDGGAIVIDLALDRPVPWRLHLMDDPPRLVADFREVDFAGADPARADRSDRVGALAWGRFVPGWSRMVATLDGPYRIAVAAMRTEDAPGATLTIRLEPVAAAAFAALAAPQPSADWALPRPAPVGPPRPRQTGDRPLFVVIDPGHGGIDPGAEDGGLSEAAIVLTFARELAETLRRAGMDVLLTREDDSFVPLELRISVARAAGADVLLSLHADSLAAGEATGATVYVLDRDAADLASVRLAERHDRADLLAGVDLSGQGDEIATVLMDLARTETAPRAARLAHALADAIGAEGLRLHRHPVQGAGFSVLKAPDIPSVLLEVGFLSSDDDRRRLADPGWRARMQRAILAGLQDWAVADAAEARLLRR